VSLQYISENNPRFTNQFCDDELDLNSLLNKAQAINVNW